MNLLEYPEFLQRKISTILWREYAAHSYLYYMLDVSIISDSDFDDLCKIILKNIDIIKKYDINNYIEESAIISGTGFNIASKVTGQTKDYAESLLKNTEYKKGDLSSFF